MTGTVTIEQALKHSLDGAKLYSTKLMMDDAEKARGVSEHLDTWRSLFKALKDPHDKFTAATALLGYAVSIQEVSDDVAGEAVKTAWLEEASALPIAAILITASNEKDLGARLDGLISAAYFTQHLPKFYSTLTEEIRDCLTAIMAMMGGTSDPCDGFTMDTHMLSVPTHIRMTTHIMRLPADSPARVEIDGWIRLMESNGWQKMRLPRATLG